MCLVVPYEKGVAYKILRKSYHNKLNCVRSPIQGTVLKIGKWITDILNNNLTFVERGQSNVERPIEAFGKNHQTGFFCFPSVYDAEQAYKKAWYMHSNNLAIYRVNYKKIVAQGVDESGRPSIVVRMIKIVDKVKDLPVNP